MSNLSWLYPTPHAIAVYASHPPSPVAAQRSLPSGRYFLLGPDFHRRDRTSLRLAHLFDHLVGECVGTGLRVGLAIGRGSGADVLGSGFCSEVLAIRRATCSWLTLSCS